MNRVFCGTDTAVAVLKEIHRLGQSEGDLARALQHHSLKLSRLIDDASRIKGRNGAPARHRHEGALSIDIKNPRAVTEAVFGNGRNALSGEGWTTNENGNGLDYRNQWVMGKLERRRYGATERLVNAIGAKLVVETRSTDLEQLGCLQPVSCGLAQRIDDSGTLSLGNDSARRRP